MILIGNITRECPQCNTDVELDINIARKPPYGQVAGICCTCGKTTSYDVTKELVEKMQERDERYSRKNIKGAFERITSELDRDMVMMVKAQFHYRNGKKHKDGSMGEIKISPGELNDALSFVILETIDSLGLQ